MSTPEPTPESSIVHVDFARGGRVNAKPLNESGGGGTSGGMKERVARLETHMEYVRRDLEELRAGQAAIIDRLDALPTKVDLNTFRWQWIATAVGAIAVIVGGIIGGLSWIKPDPSPPAPVVIQLPAAAPLAQNANPQNVSHKP